MGNIIEEKEFFLKSLQIKDRFSRVSHYPFNEIIEITAHEIGFIFGYSKGELDDLIEGVECGADDDIIDYIDIDDLHKLYLDGKITFISGSLKKITNWKEELK